MEKKVFKTGEIITPEFMNQLQDAIKETESEVGEHYGEFEELVTALMSVFTSNFDTYSVSKDGFTATLDGKRLVIGNGSISISLEPGNSGLVISHNGAGSVNVNPLQGISFYGPGADGLELKRNLIKIIGSLQGSAFPVEIKVIDGKLYIDTTLRIGGGLDVNGNEIKSFTGRIPDSGYYFIITPDEILLDGGVGAFSSRPKFYVRKNGAVYDVSGIGNLSVDSVKYTSAAVPNSLTTNDDCDDLDNYYNRYKNKEFVYRIPDAYGHAGGVVQMSTPFYLNSNSEDVGKTVSIINIGNIDLEVIYKVGDGTRLIFIPVSHGKKFICSQYGNDKIWVPLD